MGSCKVTLYNEDDVMGTRLREIQLKDPANMALKMPFDIIYSDHTGYGGQSRQRSFSGIDAEKIFSG